VETIRILVVQKIQPTIYWPQTASIPGMVAQTVTSCGREKTIESLGHPVYMTQKQKSKTYKQNNLHIH
jgi:hypothetical protein